MTHTLSELALDNVAAKQLQRVAEEHRPLARLEQHGMNPRRRLLLVGSPGAGQTMLVAALAGELGLPLFTVRLDALITGHTGETRAMLRQLFDLVVDTRGVYCFDRFDALVSQDSAGKDAGDTPSALDSFLMMVEQDHSNSLIIAAIHHPELLEVDVFGKFDDVIEC